jgi:hypothetical protein
MEEALKTRPMPVPVMGTDCGATTATGVIVTAAFKGPPICGLKVTVTVQLAPGASDVLQVFASEKSVWLVPVIAID